MVQTQNTGQITRRDFLRTLLAATIGGIIGGGIVYSGLSNIGGLKQYTATQTPYTPKSGPEQETITITYTQPPVTKTVTETKIEKETVTKTVTETKTDTITKTVTETRTETLTKPSPTTTTTTTTVRYPRTLEEILFGNSNLEFIPLIVLDVEVVDNYAWLQVKSPYTRKTTKIGIPKEYVSRDNIDIKNIVLRVRKYNSEKGGNYLVYFVLGRKGIKNAIEHDNNGWVLDVSNTHYITIISNKDWEYVHNTLKAIEDGKALVLYPTSHKGPYLINDVWAGSDQLKEKYGSDSIIIIYQDKKQVEEAMDCVKLASYILGIPDDKNPTRHGKLKVVTAATVEYRGRYENGAPIFDVRKYMGTFIAFIHQKGNYLVSNL